MQQGCLAGQDEAVMQGLVAEQHNPARTCMS